MTVVRAALVQTTWTGDKESMIDKHEEYAREAAAQGAQVICFQELFYGPYFCQVQDSQFYEYAEAVPGPTTERFQALAKELRLVIVLPVYEREEPFLYNTAAVIDADGSYLGKYRKQHIPHVGGFWEKFYFRPGNGGYPVFDTAVGKVGVYICYDRHFPEGWRALGLNGAQIVFNPSATSRGLSEYLWSIEQPAAAVANEYYVGAINRVGIEDLGDDDFYGQSYFVDPEGNYVGDKGDAHKPELIVRDLDLDLIQTVRERWAFYRDRRPDAYDDLVTSVTTLISGGTDRLRDRSGQGRRPRRRRDHRRRRRSRQHRPRQRPREHRRHRDRRDRQVRRSPAGSTATPTWSCRSAGPTPRTPSRPARRAAAWGGTTTIIDFAVQRTGERVQDGLAAWHEKAAGNCAIDYGFHQILGGVDDDSLKAMDELVADGITSFKLFMAYPGVFYSDDGQILRAMQQARENGALIMMHAENGMAIDVLVAQALARGETDPINHGLTRPWETEEEATHRAIMLARLTGAPLYVVHMRAKQAVATLAEARDEGYNVFGETCPQYLYLSLEEQLGAPGFEGAKWVCTHPAAVPRRGPPGRAVALPAHRRPQRGQHRPLPVLHEGAEGARHRRLLQDPQRDRVGRAPDGPALPGRRRRARSPSSAGSSSAPPPRPGCSASTAARASSRRAPTPTSSSTTRRATRASGTRRPTT